MIAFETADNNPMFKLAVRLINETSRHLFITGRAGTGKTTFLKHVQDTCVKNMTVVAPTGVAAINARGVTIHSFFQLPFAPFVPGYSSHSASVGRHQLLSRLRLSAEKKKVIQELDILVIDEISMVRCDLLDAVDVVMRAVRGRQTEAFGGAQLVFIGDLHQLPPVVPDNVWNILSPYYSSPYFFSSQVVQSSPPQCIEFTKIYRQRDLSFVELLNQVRNSSLDKKAFDMLHERYQPMFQPAAEEGYIVLTTHHQKADHINASALQKIAGELYSFEATVRGEFPDRSFPTDDRLKLKVGAQVMFMRNDPEGLKRFFNGKIGHVHRVEQDKIFVRCADDPEAIEVKRETWENIRYTVGGSDHELEEDVIGSFVQFPLRLAWAITIHKSQGLTFDKVIVDAGNAFAPGQVYVALSRCTAITGLILHTKINAASLKNDERIHTYMERQTMGDPEEVFRRARREYELEVVCGILEFTAISRMLNHIEKLVAVQDETFRAEGSAWIRKLSDEASVLNTVSVRFIHQLKKLTEGQSGRDIIDGRVSAATNFFKEVLARMALCLSSPPVLTNSPDFAQRVLLLLNELHIRICERLYYISFLSGGRDPGEFSKYKAAFNATELSLTTVIVQAATSPPTISHPDLYSKLKSFRDENSRATRCLPYHIATTSMLKQLVEFLPQSIDDLARLSGFGKKRISKYGQGFLEVIHSYCDQHSLGSCMPSHPGRRIGKLLQANKLPAGTAP